MQLSVVVPALNEADNLPELVSRVVGALHRMLPPETPGDAGRAELVIVDDGSSDRTPAVLAELRAIHPALTYVRHPERRGIAEAWRTGAEAARGEWLCVLDADLQYLPEEIPKLWRAVESASHSERAGAVIVQGARIERQRDVRLVISRGLNVLLNAAFDMSLRDNKSGFFMCPRRTLIELLDARPKGYRHWQCFVMVAAEHHGCQVLELSTPFSTRHRGRSAFGRVPVRATLEVLSDMARAWKHYRPARRARE